MKKILLSLVLVSLATSCATIKSGQTQQIKINSTPQGADCTLANKSTNINVRTPGVVEVNRSMSTLKIECQAPGYGNGTVDAKYGMNWWSTGNVLLLGFPYLYDMYTGSVAEYPSEINVILQPTGRTYEGNFQMRDPNSAAVVPNNIPAPQANYQQPGYGTYAPQQPAQPQMIQQPYQQYQGQQYQGQQGQYMQQQPQQVQQPQTQEQLMQEMLRERQQVTGGGQQQ